MSFIFRRDTDDDDVIEGILEEYVTVEIEFPDGSKARWRLLDGDIKTAEKLATIEETLGTPQTQRI